MKQLDRLLFEQGNQCFFCRKPLKPADASVEHLVASANGGTNGEENCVACCKKLNALLGSKSRHPKHLHLDAHGDACFGRCAATGRYRCLSPS